jgi:hypothetical protein
VLCKLSATRYELFAVQHRAHTHETTRPGTKNRGATVKAKAEGSILPFGPKKEQTILENMTHGPAGNGNFLNCNNSQHRQYKLATSSRT